MELLLQSTPSSTLLVGSLLKRLDKRSLILFVGGDFMRAQCTFVFHFCAVALIEHRDRVSARQVLDFGWKLISQSLETQTIFLLSVGF